jgi:hypothetical protein
MINKIKSIKEKVPQVTTLPDGFYCGNWGGNVIVIHFKEKTFELETEVGVKGIGYKVIVHVENGIATFDEIKN